MSFLRKYSRLQSTGALAPFIGLVSGFLLVLMISLIAYTLWTNFEKPYGSPSYYSPQASFFGCFNWYIAINVIGDKVFSSGTATQLSSELHHFLPFMAIAIPTTLFAALLAIRELRYQPTAPLANQGRALEPALPSNKICENQAIEQNSALRTNSKWHFKELGSAEPVLQQQIQ